MKREKLIYEQLNANGEIYDLYEIPKDLYTLHFMRNGSQQDEPHIY